MGSQHADSPSAGGRNDLPWTDYGISEENRNALDDRQCDPGSLLRHFSSKFSSGDLCRASRTGTWICSVSLWNTICIYADASAL